MRPAILGLFEAYQIQIFFRCIAQSGTANALHFKTEHYVLQCREPRQQLGMLEHHPAVMTAAVDLAAVDTNAAAARLIETHRNAQRSGFTAAGGADQRDDLAILDRKTDAIERLHEMNLAVHAQRKLLGHVEKGHLTHSTLRFL